MPPRGGEDSGKAALDAFFGQRVGLLSEGAAGEILGAQVGSLSDRTSGLGQPEKSPPASPLSDLRWFPEALSKHDTHRQRKAVATTMVRFMGNRQTRAV